MTRTSLTIGMSVSLAVHIAVFLPSLFRPVTTPEREATDERVTVVMDAPEPGSEPEVEPSLATPQPPQPAPLPKPPAPQEQPALASLSREAEARVDADELVLDGDQSPRDPDPDALPELRIVWSGPEEVRAVGRALGMRIVAIDQDQRVIGQLSLAGNPNIEPFQGTFSEYSNRVRSLPRSMFETADSPSGYWILVPSLVDREIASVVRQAIQSAGLSPSDVSWVEGRFVRQRGRSYGLSITHIRERTR